MSFDYYTSLLASFEHHELSADAREQVDETRDLFHELAYTLVQELPDGPEKTRALVILRQAKDAAVIAVVLDDQDPS